jgi:hypothetical protein
METVHSKFLNISSIFCFPGGPRVLTNMSSGDIKAKQGDLVNLLCSAQGEPPIIFSWEKDTSHWKVSSKSTSPTAVLSLL